MGILDLKPSEEIKAKTKIDAIFANPELSQDYKDHLLAALIHPSFASSEIHKALVEDGHDIGVTAVKMYRQKLSLLVKSQSEETE